MNIVKVISAFVGVMVVVGSLGMIGAGTVALATGDTDGYFTAGPIHLTTDASALVGDDLDVFIDGPFVDRVALEPLGVELDVASRNGKDVFVGIGPVDDVRRYLSDVRHASIEFDRNDVVVIGHDGTSRVAVPGNQTFWVAETTDGTLSWDIENGRWAVALLNADGTPDVDVEVTAAARLPFVRPIGIGLIVVGVIGLCIGAGLTYLGVRSRPQHPATSVENNEAVPVA
jgi:hypothetical protein